MDDPLRQESSPRIDWKSAEVSDGELRVSLAGEAPKGWGGRVGEVLERLSATSRRAADRAQAVIGMWPGCAATRRSQSATAG